MDSPGCRVVLFDLWQKFRVRGMQDFRTGEEFQNKDCVVWNRSFVVPVQDGNLATIGGNAERCGIISQLRPGLTIGSEVTDSPVQQGDKASVCCLYTWIPQTLPLFLRRARVLEDTPAPSRTLVVSQHPSALDGTAPTCGIFVLTAHLIDKERSFHLLTRRRRSRNGIPRNVPQCDPTERKHVLGINDTDIVRPIARTFPDNATMMPYHARQAAASTRTCAPRITFQQFECFIIKCVYFPCFNINYLGVSMVYSPFPPSPFWVRIKFPQSHIGRIR